MGVPLLLIGAGGAALLPKSGAWMTRVRMVSGWLLLATALWTLRTLLPDYFYSGLWAVLLIILSVLLGVFDALAHGELNQQRAKIIKGLAYLPLAWALAIVFGAAQGHFDVLQPLRTNTQGAALQIAAPSYQTTKVVNSNQLQAALAQAQQLGKPAMLDVYADWCVSCIEMEKLTLKHPEVVQALLPFVVIKLDVTDNTQNQQALLKQYGLFGPPAMMFFNSNGQRLASSTVIGFLNAAAFAKHLKSLKVT